MTLCVARMAEHTVTHVRRGRSMFSARGNVPAKGRSALLYMTRSVERMEEPTATPARPGRTMLSAGESVLVNKAPYVLQYTPLCVVRMEGPTVTVVWHRMLVLSVMEDAPARSQCSVPRSMNQSVARMGSHTAISAMQGGTISGVGGSVLAHGDNRVDHCSNHYLTTTNNN